MVHFSTFPPIQGWSPIYWSVFTAVFVFGFLYSSVGHGGASAYAAVLTQAGCSLETVRPQILVMNIAVALLTLSQYTKRGHFDWKLCWPFTIAAVPLAMVGATTPVSPGVFRVLLGTCLLASAIWLLMPKQTSFENRKEAVIPPPTGLAMCCGAVIGLLAGLTGTGGGVFLTPVLILSGWAKQKPAAAASAAFILANSLAGLAGTLWKKSNGLQIDMTLLTVALLGGFFGAKWGSSSQVSSRVIRRILATVVCVAGIKLCWIY